MSPETSGDVALHRATSPDVLSPSTSVQSNLIMSPEKVVLYSAAYIMMNASRTKKKRRWWIKQYLRNKTSVFNDLSVLDSSFHNFTRMSSTDFEILLYKISPSISKQKTRFRDPVDAKVRLAVTLR